MTNIWPMPTMTKNAEKLRAPDSSEPAPAPPVKAMVASQISNAAKNDHNQGLRVSVDNEARGFIGAGSPGD